MICAICEIEAERGQRCASPSCERWICEACAEGSYMCSECCANERKETVAVNVFVEYVRAELIIAREKYRPMASAHEGWAVLREEVDELWDEVRKKPSQRSTLAMYHELVQISAMAQRMAEDVCDTWKAVEL
jgi:hypothetical protein